MAVTKTDWSKPASDPVNRGQSAEAARYQAMADYYRPGGQGQPLASGAVYAGGSPAQRVSDISVPGPRTEEDQVIYDAAIERALQSLAAQEEAARVAAAQQMRAQEAAFAGGLPMGPTLAPAMDFGFGASLGQIAYPTAYQTFTPGQQASLNRYLEAGETGRGFGLGSAILGALGAPSKYDQLSSGDYRPVFVGDELYGAFGAGPFGGNVYTGRTLPYETAQEYGIPGYFPPEEGDSAPEVTAPIQDPATGQQRCPDGYIFDEDLNACRLAPMDVTATTATPGEAYARTGLLDVAPEGLLDFRQRYGAGFGTPMDFEAANLAFRRQGATYPEYFRTAPKLDGYTLLS
jgi:hypothetical protein